MKYFILVICAIGAVGFSTKISTLISKLQQTFNRLSLKKNTKLKTRNRNMIIREINLTGTGESTLDVKRRIRLQKLRRVNAALRCPRFWAKKFTKIARSNVKQRKIGSVVIPSALSRRTTLVTRLESLVLRTLKNL